MLFDTNNRYSQTLLFVDLQMQLSELNYLFILAQTSNKRKERCVMEYKNLITKSSKDGFNDWSSVRLVTEEDYSECNEHKSEFTCPIHN